MRRLPRALVAVLLVSPLAGCLGRDSPDPSPLDVDFVAGTVAEGVARLQGLRATPLELDVEVTINVVFVGLDARHVDTAAVAEALPKDYSPLVRFDRAHQDGETRSGFTQRIRYAFHEAPAAFARDLFAFYPTVAREAPIPADAGAPGFLERYDALYGLGRAGSGQVHVVDAQKVEAWIEAHRAGAGLDFPSPQYTVFFLDSWTRHGLWKDSYYWYEYAPEAPVAPDAWNLRAWGGTHDFVFLDYAAAPNDALFDNVGLASVMPLGPGFTPVPVPAPEGTAYNDPPVWHYRDGVATVGQGPTQKTVTLTDRVRHALDVAVSIRLLGDYTLPPVYAEHYHVNVHLWHDGRSQMPTQGLEGLLPLDRIVDGIQREVPWSRVTGSVKTYLAPRDDPEMAAALDEAKAKGVQHLPSRVVTNVVDANLDRYTDRGAGGYQILALFFLLEGGFAFFPGLSGGIALGSADGLGWGTITHANDVGYQNYGRDMEPLVASMVGINAHEVGHYFGLHHAHDGYRRTAGGYEAYGDHTWSSTNTVMSYRLAPPTTDTFHRDILARAHAHQNLDRAERNVEAAYLAWAGRGVGTVPGGAAEALREATGAYNEARRLFTAGRFEDAVREAVQAREASEAALQAAGVTTREDTVLSWTRSGVTAAGAKHPSVVFEASASAQADRWDLRRLVLDPDVERVTVRVTWTNQPASWGDFSAAWRAEGLSDLLAVNAFEVGERVDFGGGVHDTRSEGPASGPATEEFTIDLDAFPSLRDGKAIEVGAGTRGMAANGAYAVDVVVERRQP